MICQKTSDNRVLEVITQRLRPSQALGTLGDIGLLKPRTYEVNRDE